MTNHSLVPRPTSTAADVLHHRYVEVGSGESLGKNVASGRL